MNKKIRALIITLFMVGLGITMGILGTLHFNRGLMGWAISGWIVAFFDILIAYIWFSIWREESRKEKAEE